MDASPKLVWAMLVLAATGGGALIGNTPPMLQAGQGVELPDARWVTPPSAADSPAQDQYAIVTPEGRFEVEELSHRGLYSQARYEDYGVYSEQEYVEVDAGYLALPPAGLAIPPIAQDQVELTASETAVSLPHAEAPATLTDQEVAAGSPRIVDVAAELAAVR